MVNQVTSQDWRPVMITFKANMQACESILASMKIKRGVGDIGLTLGSCRRPDRWGRCKPSG